MIRKNFAVSLVDMTLPNKIQELYTTKWKAKEDSFIDLDLKSNVFALLGELNKLNNSLLDGYGLISIKSTRIRIRNLYVNLHPESFSVDFPYDAFIDDWNDGEF